MVYVARYINHNTGDNGILGVRRSEKDAKMLLFRNGYTRLDADGNFKDSGKHRAWIERFDLDEEIDYI